MEKISSGQKYGSTGNVYSSATLTRSICISMGTIGSNLEQRLNSILSSQLEGKCCADGFIQHGSIKIISYSSGMIRDEFVEFQTVFECMIANPVEGQTISCIVENVTKAGIKCKVDMDISPLIIFVARDHHFMNAYFTSIGEGDVITVKVIGQRYELNDPYISVIATLIESKASTEHKKKRRKPKQPKIVLETA
jgi:DNA-directed RNA polymerase subunit E'/Rpb7